MLKIVLIFWKDKNKFKNHLNISKQHKTRIIIFKKLLKKFVSIKTFFSNILSSPFSAHVLWKQIISAILHPFCRKSFLSLPWVYLAFFVVQTHLIVKYSFLETPANSEIEQQRLSPTEMKWRSCVKVSLSLYM